MSGKVGKKKREMKGNPWIKKGKVGKEGERKRGNKEGGRDYSLHLYVGRDRFQDPLAPQNPWMLKSLI